MKASKQYTEDTECVAAVFLNEIGGMGDDDDNKFRVRAKSFLKSKSLLSYTG